MRVVNQSLWRIVDPAGVRDSCVVRVIKSFVDAIGETVITCRLLNPKTAYYGIDTGWFVVPLFPPGPVRGAVVWRTIGGGRRWDSKSEFHMCIAFVESVPDYVLAHTVGVSGRIS